MDSRPSREASGPCVECGYYVHNEPKEDAERRAIHEGHLLMDSRPSREATCATCEPWHRDYNTAAANGLGGSARLIDRRIAAHERDVHQHAILAALPSETPSDPERLDAALRDFAAILPADRWHLLRDETQATLAARLDVNAT